MADNEHWRNCRIQAWAKLDRRCARCDKPNAEIEFTFSCKGLPIGHMQSGQRARAWHWACLPDALKDWQREDERLMKEECQKPFRN